MNATDNISNDIGEFDGNLAVVNKVISQIRTVKPSGRSSMVYGCINPNGVELIIKIEGIISY